ncbi:MAG: ribonuclease HII [Bacillota bacterium]|nr:ribonuclease HII [Bacillota bacterium]
MTRLDAAADTARVAGMWRHEQRLIRAAGWHGPLAGVDEAGRGPLAGPVAAAAVVLPRRLYLPGLDDSKRLTAGARDELEPLIRERSRASAVAVIPVECIDRINILQATRLAMRRALAGLGTQPAGVLLDGTAVPDLGYPQLAVIDGDALCASIAAASILAKVARDRFMQALDRIYPQYGFARHKGYCTPEHIAALRRFGPCPAHRRSFSWRGAGLFELEQVEPGF